MAEQSTAEKIAFHEAELVKLRTQAHNPIEYPKAIADPRDPTGQAHAIANDAEHEKKIRASHKKDGLPTGTTSADQKLKQAEIKAAALPEVAPDVQKVVIVNPEAEDAALLAASEPTKAPKPKAPRATTRKK